MSVAAVFVSPPRLRRIPLLLSALAARRAVSATIFAGAIAGVTLFGVVPSAIADPPPPPPPGCSAGDYEQVKANVATATAAYFFTHPDVNAFFSTLKGQPKDQTQGSVKAYFDSNPQVQAELTGIRQPMRDFRGRCEYPKPG
jgi:hemophore-related protein